MYDLLRKYDLKTVRVKLLIIYILNTLDIVFTLILFPTGLFTEKNIIMINIIKNPFYSIILKVFIVGIFIVLLCIRIKKATKQQLFYSNIIINCCLLCYLFIIFTHIIWSIISLYFFFV